MFESYVYLVKSKVTGQFYYGSRCKNVRLERTPEQDFWTHYTTSSKKVKQLIKDFGKDSFETQIIFKSLDYNQCYDLEQTLIQEHILDEHCLNLYCRASQKFSTFGLTHSDETKAKISAKAKNRVMSEETKQKISSTTRGKSKTPEHIEAAAAGRRGKKNKDPAWNKGLVGVQVAWNKGKAWPTTQCAHCGKAASPANYKRWHGDACKMITLLYGSSSQQNYSHHAK